MTKCKNAINYTRRFHTTCHHPKHSKNSISHLLCRGYVLYTSLATFTQCCQNKHHLNYIYKLARVQKENCHGSCTYPSYTMLPWHWHVKSLNTCPWRNLSLFLLCNFQIAHQDQQHKQIFRSLELVIFSNPIFLSPYFLMNPLYCPNILKLQYFPRLKTDYWNLEFSACQNSWNVYKPTDCLLSLFQHLT